MLINNEMPQDDVVMNTEGAEKASDGTSAETALTPSSAEQSKNAGGVAATGTELVPVAKDVVSVSTKKGWNRALSIVRANLENIEEWRGEGKTFEQIADLLGISRSSLYRFREQDAEVHDALYRGAERYRDKLKSKLHEHVLNGVTRVEQKEEIGEDGQLHVVERKITNTGPDLKMLHTIVSRDPDYSKYKGIKYYRETFGSWPKEEEKEKPRYYY